MDNVYVGEGSKLRDRHVEKLFLDLHDGTHVEDDISFHNLKVYLAELYGYDEPYMEWNVEQLILASTAVGTIQIDRANDGNRFRVRFTDWENDNLYVFNPDLAVAIAMAIVQSMRHATVDHLNAGRDRKH